MEDRSRCSETSRTLAKASGDSEFEYNWTQSNVGFDDIGGYYEVKERLAEEVLQPVRATARGDDRYDRFGIEPSQGILFHGPPGTGKPCLPAHSPASSASRSWNSDRQM
ncbi:hypothetical protein VB773_20355 [Haloarculaceae archaeon H-GB2-1]|nr:hypothetical protein [Haloarculaceae archaeon H-GB2-1]